MVVALWSGLWSNVHIYSVISCEKRKLQRLGIRGLRDVKYEKLEILEQYQDKSLVRVIKEHFSCYGSTSEMNTKAPKSQRQ